MNVHRGSESDRLLLQEASCLMDETSAAAQEKETNSLTSSGLQNLAYPLTPRSDGMETKYWLNVEGFLTPEHPLCPEDIMFLIFINKISISLV